MEEQKTTLAGTLLERVEAYGKASFDLYRLKAIDKAADITSSVVSSLVVGILLAFFFLILNIGVALWIGEELGKSHYGFFVVAGFYAITGSFLYIFRQQLLKMPINNAIITHALK